MMTWMMCCVDMEGVLSRHERGAMMTLMIYLHILCTMFAYMTCYFAYVMCYVCIYHVLCLHISCGMFVYVMCYDDIEGGLR